MWSSLSPLNLHKTELIWFGSRTNLQNLAAVPGTSSLTVTCDVVQGVNAVHDLDSKLSMQNHVNKSLELASVTFDDWSKYENFSDRMLWLNSLRLWYSVDFDAVLAGLPRSTIAPLQWVQNTAARLVTRLWSTRLRDPDSERPSLATRRTANSVQTMSADASRSHRKSAILSLKLRHCTSRHHFSSSSALHYSERQQTRLKFGERSFYCAGPRAWNSLPSTLHELMNTSTFKRHRKTFLFQQAYGCWLGKFSRLRNIAKCVPPVFLPISVSICVFAF